jgi:hypothetical protein
MRVEFPRVSACEIAPDKMEHIRGGKQQPMTTRYETQLTIDFGETGYHYDKQPFCVMLDAGPLTKLIEHARQAHRIYELTLIQRPGDIWRYVTVVPKQLTERARRHLIYAYREKAPDKKEARDENLDLRVSFEEFTRIFNPQYYVDDYDPECEAWLGVRGSAVVQAFGKQLLTLVRSARSCLDRNDPLIAFVLESIREGTHAFDRLPRERILDDIEERPPTEPMHTPEFYRKLGELLRHPDVASVAYRGDGDYHLQRMLATEQRRRASATGHSPGIALHVGALSNRPISNGAWDSEIWFFDEGLSYGDLHIEDKKHAGNSVSTLLTQYGKVFGRFILSDKREGDMPGYTFESGPGWILYTKRESPSRRLALDRIHDRRTPANRKRVFEFAALGATMFGYDKTVIIVGAGVDEDVRAALAASIAPWQRDGGDPLVIAEGDTAAFDAAGCRDIEIVPDTVRSGDANTQRQWFKDLLRRRRPWADVVLALHAPDWLAEALRNSGKFNRVWPLWVVATADSGHLAADFTLDGDLAAILRKAAQDASFTLRFSL